MEYSNGTPNLKPFHCFGSRLSLWSTCSTMAWPLMFSTAGMMNGSGVEPAPMVIARGMGVSICEASYSPARDLSRATAQPAVLVTVTSRPYRS